jgi:hypothetical protein
MDCPNAEDPPRTMGMAMTSATAPSNAAVPIVDQAALRIIQPSAPQECSIPRFNSGTRREPPHHQK